MPTKAPSKINILIVDDMASVRQGLHTILQLAEDFEVVGEACDGLEAVHAAGDLRPDIVIMDLEMPRMGGMEATRRIKDLYSEIGIVILTIHGGDEVYEQAAKAGADAFIEKEAPTESLMTAIRDVRAAVRQDLREEKHDH